MADHIDFSDSGRQHHDDKDFRQRVRDQADLVQRRGANPQR